LTKGYVCGHVVALIAQDELVNNIETGRSNLESHDVRVVLNADGLLVNSPISNGHMGGSHRILDVGCGCGLIAAAAAQLAGSGGSVTAIDILPDALCLSRENLANQRERDEE
jgi:methylase of polypeptide subunit release factors